MNVAGPAAAEQPSLNEVLARMGQYLVDYEARLSAVVAEEHYEQWLATPTGVRTQTARTLVSDFLFIRLPGGAEWLGLRDVLLVDGKPLREREERLLALLTQGPPDALERAIKIAVENARYNLLGNDVFRTINVPTQVLELLSRQNHARFSFRKAGEATIAGTRAWKIEYAEHTRPTVIRTPGGRDRLARGIVWVEPVGGAVLRTQLDLGGDDFDFDANNVFSTLRAQTTVNYGRDARLDLRVPVEMREEYRRPTRVIRGLATYRNFRRFETSGRIAPPPKP